MPDRVKEVLAAIDRAELTPARSSLSRWMRQNHDALAARIGDGLTDWTTLAKVFEEAGLTDRTGKPASPETARKAWERARKTVASTRAARATPLPPARPAVSPAPAVAAPSAGENGSDFGETPRAPPKPIQPKGRT